MLPTSNASFSATTWSYKLKFKLVGDQVSYFQFLLLGGHSVLSIGVEFEGSRGHSASKRCQGDSSQQTVCLIVGMWNGSCFS